uniref:Uncharacterized protein n=1 Tax=Rhizophagus irregularis (strain DAOM 181602 / DAOM 197198 / MUCL 43194) TaxID=747089 RepID=U9UCA5_RHIID
MEPLNTIDENSFDPTPRLKSSPIPIKFISFDIGDKNYVYIYTMDLECIEHEISRTKMDTLVIMDLIETISPYTIM